MKVKFKKQLLSFGLLGVLGTLIYILNPSNEVKKSQKILPPLEGMEHFNFGFEDTAADLLWLNFIQNSFTCSKYRDPKHERCPHRWGYRVLNEASKLSPKFEALYKYGAVKLTVLLDDHLGAAEIYDRGLKYFKTNWVINYRASYLYMRELKDYARAGELLELAGRYGAPFWTKSLASKMYDKSGQLEISYRLLMDLYKEAEPGAWRESLKERIQALLAKIEQN